MKRAARPFRPSLLTLAVGLAACVWPAAARGQTPADEAASPVAAPPAASAPAEAAPPATAGERFRELDANRRRQPAESAEHAALYFLLSVAVGDGENAVRVVDEIGFQPLPLRGVLPEDPPRPVRAAALKEAIAARPDANVHDAPAATLRLVTPRDLRSEFPAVADWMLPGDYAMIVDPPPAHVKNWVRQRGCIVVRVRGPIGTVLGGNLFEAFSDPPPPEPAAEPPAEP